MSSISNLYTIAFYNTENLFDIYLDRRTNDNDFLPTSAKNWTKKRYETKIYKLGSVISKIGVESAQKPPTIIGLAEVENDSVLKDLINSEDLKLYNYKFIHYNSLDERGIDVALLYNEDEFTVEHSETFNIYIQDEQAEQDFTRDILLVTGYLNNEKIHILVNHWPSRHEGSDQTEYKRLLASKKASEIIANLKEHNLDSKIIVMGDFNDNPTSNSMLQLKKENSLYNVTESLWSYSRGSVNHNFTWILFDQILLSQNFLNLKGQGLQFERANIFDEKFLTQHKGKFKGQPFRTYVGKKYKGGFSDHFPVYIQLKK